VGCLWVSGATANVCKKALRALPRVSPGCSTLRQALVSRSPPAEPFHGAGGVCAHPLPRCPANHSGSAEGGLSVRPSVGPPVLLPPAGVRRRRVRRGTTPGERRGEGGHRRPAPPRRALKRAAERRGWQWEAAAGGRRVGGRPGGCGAQSCPGEPPGPARTPSTHRQAACSSARHPWAAGTCPPPPPGGTPRPPRPGLRAS